MPTKNLPKELTEKKDVRTADVAKSPSNQAFMSGGLRDWLGNITVQNHSGESINDLLKKEQYGRETPIASAVEGRRHSRKTSGGSQLVRAKSSHKLTRNRAEIQGPEATVASPNNKRLRFSATIPFLLSAAAFSFSLVLVLAGSRPGYLTEVNLISVSHTAPLLITILDNIYSSIILIT